MLAYVQCTSVEDNEEKPDRGPGTDPCGTPDEMFWKEVLHRLTVVQTLQFFR